MTPCKRLFCTAKEPARGRQPCVSRPVTFCILPFVFLLSVTNPSLAASVGWAATYGGSKSDYASAIQQTDDGGYIVAGGTESFGAGKEDFLILKLTPDGAVEWQKTYGGADEDRAYFIQQTGDEGYIVVGKTESFGAGDEDVWVLKLRPDGSVEWQKTYGGTNRDTAFSIQQTSDRGYIVAGGAAFSSEGRNDAWVLKLRYDGTVEWQKTYGGTGSDDVISIQQTDDGYIVAGLTKSFGDEKNAALVLKLGTDGTMEWQKAYGGISKNVALSIRQTRDGGFVAAGMTTSLGAGLMAAWVLKLGPDGTTEWQKAYGGAGTDTAVSIRQTSDDEYIVVGVTTSSGAGNEDVWVLKLRTDGTVEWQKTYGGINRDIAASIQQAADGGYIAAGQTKSFGAGDKDIWVLKLRPDGSIDPSCEFIRDTSASVGLGLATFKSPGVNVRDSGATPQDSSAVVKDTNVSANILCASTVIK